MQVLVSCLKVEGILKVFKLILCVLEFSFYAWRHLNVLFLRPVFYELFILV